MKRDFKQIALLCLARDLRNFRQLLEKEIKNFQSTPCLSTKFLSEPNEPQRVRRGGPISYQKAIKFYQE